MGATVSADLFKGHLDAGVQIHGIGKPPTAKVRIDLKGLSLGSVHDFLALSLPLDGSVDTFSVRFDGQTDQPKSWDAQVDSRLSGVAVAGATLDASNLRVSLRDGVVEVEQADAVAGVNTVHATARIVLADRMADLPKSDGHGTISHLRAGLYQAPGEAAGGDWQGSLEGQRRFHAARRQVQRDPQGSRAGLSPCRPRNFAVVQSMDFALDSSKVFPAGATAPPIATPGAPPTAARTVLPKPANAPLGGGPGRDRLHRLQARQLQAHARPRTARA